jgi:hypothetical protein
MKLAEDYSLLVKIKRFISVIHIIRMVQVVKFGVVDILVWEFAYKEQQFR